MTPVEAKVIQFVVPFAHVLQGFKVDVPTVLKLARYPVPVLAVVSCQVHKLAVLVPVPVVKVLVLAPIVRARLVDGLVRESQAVAAEPEQEPKTGTPPSVETKQSVPAPPVAAPTKAVPFQ